MALRVWLALALVVALVAGCGGGDEEATTPAPTTPSNVASASPSAVIGGTTAGSGVAETLSDAPFVLNESQPVPMEFQSAYQRGSLIVVEFYKAGDDPFYPQGLSPDTTTSRYLEDLRPQYAEMEFFTYEISDHGESLTSEGLQPGQYGSLASQLGVGFTPFVVMLAPQEGGGYVVENLFQGYVPQPVLNQALFDLASNATQANTSEVDVTLEQVDLTSDGSGIDFFTVQNRTEEPVNLQGFSLQVLDPETGNVSRGSPRVSINDQTLVPPDQSVSLGRVPDLQAEGGSVAGTFEDGQDLDLSPGDQIALVDTTGAVASQYTPTL